MNVRASEPYEAHGAGEIADDQLMEQAKAVASAAETLDHIPRDDTRRGGSRMVGRSQSVRRSS